MKMQWLVKKSLLERKSIKWGKGSRPREGKHRLRLGERSGRRKGRQGEGTEWGRGRGAREMEGDEAGEEGEGGRWKGVWAGRERKERRWMGVGEGREGAGKERGRGREREVGGSRT